MIINAAKEYSIRLVLFNFIITNILVVMKLIIQKQGCNYPKTGLIRLIFDIKRI